MIYKKFIEELQSENISDNAEIVGTLCIANDDNHGKYCVINQDDDYLYFNDIWL